MAACSVRRSWRCRPGRDGSLVGCPVALCRGPAPDQTCAGVTGGGCGEFDWNDEEAVVFGLDLDRPQHRAILLHHRRLGQDLHPRAVVTPEQAVRHASLLRDVRVWFDMGSTQADTDSDAPTETVPMLPAR